MLSINISAYKGDHDVPHNHVLVCILSIICIYIANLLAEYSQMVSV